MKMTRLSWLTRPRRLLARLRYWVWEKRNPDKPWMCPGTIAFCQSKLSGSMKALEFGSGRSTLWFATLVGHLTSIEYDESWYQQIAQRLREAGAKNVDYRHVPLGHPRLEPERSAYQPVPDYVAVADSFPDRGLDFVVVDGHYRTNCIRHVLPKIAPGGYLLVDDIDRWPSLDEFTIPSSWRIVDDSTNGMKRCVVWQAS
jgi:predicted O-methyltransferase YrrM